MNTITTKRAAVVCLACLAIATLYLCYLIAKPFLGPVPIALMLAIVFYPIHASIQIVFHRPNGAAAVSTTIALLIVTIPLVILGISVSRELHAAVQSLREQSWPQVGSNPYVEQWVGAYLNV